MKKTKVSVLRKIFDLRHWRIATKLLVFMLLLSLVPLVISTMLSSRTSSDIIIKQTRISLSRLAISTAERIEQFLIDNHYVIRMAASDPNVIAFLSAATEEEQAGQQATIDTVVANLLAADPALDLVGFYDLEGTVVSHNNPDIVGRSYLFRDYVQSALGGEQFTSGIQVGWTTDTPGINASAPVVVDDEVIGAIATRIQGIFITEILKSSLAAESEDITAEERQAMDVYLLDEYRIIVGHSDDETEWLYHSLGEITDQQVLDEIESVRLLGGDCPNMLPVCDPNTKEVRLPQAIPAAQPLGDHLLRAMVAGKSGSFRYCRPASIEEPLTEDGECNGAWHVVGYAPVLDPFRVNRYTQQPIHLFMVVVDMPEEIFLSSITQLQTQGLIILALMAALALVASTLISRTLARPLGKLAQAAQRVESDEPFEPEDIDNVCQQGDEVGNLARVFSAMVVALRARMAELRTIYAVGQKISESVDLQETMRDIMLSISDIMRFDTGEICLYDKLTKKLSCEIAMDGSTKASDLACNRTYRTDQGAVARLFEQESGVLIHDVLSAEMADPSRNWGGVQPRSYIGVPLKDKNQIIGTIEFVDRHANCFTEANLRVLESIAIQAAIAIQNAREVQLRENRLKQEIQQLRIEIDEMKKERQVAEIVETDYFQSLRKKAQDLRGEKSSE
ncbi:MAG: GAF domain-containing protein [Anaerolineae bacterium]|nr:GAF domain-containing protein [Anaerolineae bacterium]